MCSDILLSASAFGGWGSATAFGGWGAAPTTPPELRPGLDQGFTLDPFAPFLEEILREFKRFWRRGAAHSTPIKKFSLTASTDRLRLIGLYYYNIIPEENFNEKSYKRYV